MPSEALIDLLDARSGVVCAVGAGGKKSVLYQLVREHGGHVALTTTVHMTVFPEELPMETVIGDDPDLLERVPPAARSRSIAYACPSQKEGRYAGVAPATIRALHDEAGFAATFVKADGARMRWIKAPAEGEPVLVPGADVIVPVISARAIGEPLSERVAHRIDQVEAATGIDRGEILTPESIARLLARDADALGTGGSARVAPVINMVDNDLQEKKARAVAEAALAMTSHFDRVVLCCLKRPAAPVVAVVGR